MNWGMVIGSFIGTFTANIVFIAILFYFAWPKIKKAVNPFGGLIEK